MTGKKQITPDQKADIVSRAVLERQADLAREYELTPSRVSQIVRAAGIPQDDSLPGRRRLTEQATAVMERPAVNGNGHHPLPDGEVDMLALVGDWMQTGITPKLSTREAKDFSVMAERMARATKNRPEPGIPWAEAPELAMMVYRVFLDVCCEACVDKMSGSIGLINGWYHERWPNAPQD